MQVADPKTPLSRDDFPLIGFDRLLTPLDEMLASVEIRHREPQAPVINDAVFVPAMKVGLHLFEGALLTADGQPIAQARSERRNSRMGDLTLGALSEPVVLEPGETIEDEVVYLGWYFDHFGHFLLESLARTWVLPRLDPSVKFVFHRERPNPLGATTQRMLDLLGVTRDRILFLDRQTRLRRVIVPEPLYEISHAAHTAMPRPYHQVARAVLGDDTDDIADQPLYLSRRLLSSRQRPIIGEFELEEVLRENGFLIAHPETMALEDQIRLVNRHKEIVTSAGSAAYLPLFALEPGRLHTLTTDLPFVDYFMIPKVARIPASFVNCLAGGDRLSQHYLPQMAQMDVFAAYLDSLGMLKRTLRSSLTIQHADLKPAYDEAWLYKFLRHGMRTEHLSPEFDAEATKLAETSWPIAWTLARYWTRHAPDRVEPLVGHFMDLITVEADPARLMHYREDVAASVHQLLRHCSDETAAALNQVLADCLLIDPAAERTRRTERRRPRERDAAGEAEPAAASPV